MGDIKRMSDDALRAELARREAASKPACPVAIAPSDIDWKPVIQLADSGATLEELENPDSDIKGYIYEAVMEARYGKRFWAYANSIK